MDGGIYLSVTLTLAVLLAFLLSITVNSNIISVSDDMSLGAVNVAMGVLAPFNVTLGPTICFHKYDVIVPSGSLLLLPSRVTKCPVFTVRLVPALDIGGWLDGGIYLSVTLTLTDYLHFCYL